jgi:dinuclear metal center protein, YbgI/SA1388 family
MITCQDILNTMEEFAPVSLAYDWDNCGLLCGNKKKEVKNVLVCLDCDLNVITEAKEKNVDMILSHHPAIFSEIKRFDEEHYYGRFLKTLLQSDICYYAGHTNIDTAKGGLNDLLAEKIGLPTPSGVMEKIGENDGIGRIFELSSPTTVKDLCQKIKAGLHTECLTYTGEIDRLVKKIALCSGGGDGFSSFALEQNCDVYISGDFHHNKGIECLGDGMSLIDVSHYDSEIIVKEVFERVLKKAFGDNLYVICSEANKPVFHAFIG